MKKVSIVIPVYNVAAFIEECLKSVMNQTYQNLDIIVINDGSTDQSGTICRKYASLDSRIHYIEQPNQGLSAARNRGIREAKGYYISFVDSDDMIAMDYVSILVGIAEETRTKIVQCNYRMIAENGHVNMMLETGRLKTTLLSRHEAYNSLYEGQIRVKTMACAKLFTTDLFQNVRFPVGRLHEDEFVIHQLLYQINKIAVNNAPLYYYRRRKGSIMSKKSKKRKKDTFLAHFDRTVFFIQRGEWLLAWKTIQFYFSKFLIN